MTRRFWTAAELEELRARYPHEPTKVLADHFKRKLADVYAKANGMGLTKTAEHLAVHGARFDGTQGKQHRFSSTQAPWNKGMKYEAGGRSTEHQFKPGNVPHTAVPIGTVRKTVDGYLTRKVREDAGKGMSRRNWVFLHVELWEQHHGPVPPGHVVTFVNSNREDVRIENLRCVPRRELMKRNTVHNLPKELALAVQLRGQLVRKINEREGKHEKRNRRPAKPPVRDAGGVEGSGQPDGT
jgi:hypothetical protein